MRGEHTRRNQGPHEQRGQDGGFKRDGKHESFAAKPARTYSRGGIVIHQAFRQASEIAHGHTSTTRRLVTVLQISFL